MRWVIAIVGIWFLMPTQAEERVEVEFSQIIETCIRPEVLWEQLSVSMIDSKDSWIWLLHVAK